LVFLDSIRLFSEIANPKIINILSEFYLSRFVVGSSKANIPQLIEKASDKAILITIEAKTF